MPYYKLVEPGKRDTVDTVGYTYTGATEIGKVPQPAQQDIAPMSTKALGPAAYTLSSGTAAQLSNWQISYTPSATILDWDINRGSNFVVAYSSGGTTAALPQGANILHKNAHQNAFMSPNCSCYIAINIQGSSWDNRTATIIYSSEYGWKETDSSYNRGGAPYFGNYGGGINCYSKFYVNAVSSDYRSGVSASNISTYQSKLCMNPGYWTSKPFKDTVVTTPGLDGDALLSEVSKWTRNYTGWDQAPFTYRQSTGALVFYSAI